MAGLRFGFWPLLCSGFLLQALLNLFLVQGTNGDFFNYGHRFIRNRKEVYKQWGSMSDVKTAWFSQRLNHFDPSDTREWQQRYFINDAFYKPGGPVFVFIGGEEEALAVWMKNGQWINFAEKLGAYCIQIEHRFYGKSHPTPDASLGNLRYLTSEQALADLATFTVAMKREKFHGNKWVIFGGSYSGSLAAWYRLKYPHLVDIAVASSAPLQAQFNYKGYLAVMSDIMHHTYPECAKVVQEAVHSLEQLWKRGPAGWEVIQRTFQNFPQVSNANCVHSLCSPLNGNDPKDVSTFFEMVTCNWQEIFQYNGDNRAFDGAKTANITVRHICDIMTQKTPDFGGKTAMQKYADVNAFILNAMNESCLDAQYSKMVHELQETDWNSSFVVEGARQWTFQTCTEFGFFQSSDFVDQPFGHDFPVEFSVQACQDVYGSKYDRNFIENAIKWTNTNYGGKDIKVSRVIFVNGSNDPWHLPGITAQSETTKDNLVIFIHGTAHCADMYPSSAKDPQQLKDARVRIFQQIKAWLQK